MSSPAQIAANQINALRSTGPVTDAGKAASSQNALKHGLTGRTVLLPTDDPNAYAQHHELFEHTLQPTTAEEHTLVHELADIRWRLDRIATVETGLHSLGHKEFAPLFEEDPASVRLAMIQAHTYRQYAKDFRNLHTQENRLRRAEQQLFHKLETIQRDRREQAQEAQPTASPTHRLQEAAALYSLALEAGEPFLPSQFGFEFSTTQIERFLAATQLKKAA